MEDAGDALVSVMSVAVLVWLIPVPITKPFVLKVGLVVELNNDVVPVSTPALDMSIKVDGRVLDNVTSVLLLVTLNPIPAAIPFVEKLGFVEAAFMIDCPVLLVSTKLINVDGKVLDNVISVVFAVTPNPVPTFKPFVLKDGLVVEFNSVSPPVPLLVSVTFDDTVPAMVRSVPVSVIVMPLPALIPLVVKLGFVVELMIEKLTGLVPEFVNDIDEAGDEFVNVMSVAVAVALIPVPMVSPFVEKLGLVVLFKRD